MKGYFSVPAKDPRLEHNQYGHNPYACEHCRPICEEWVFIEPIRSRKGTLHLAHFIFDGSVQKAWITLNTLVVGDLTYVQKWEDFVIDGVPAFSKDHSLSPAVFCDQIYALIKARNYRTDYFPDGDYSDLF